MVILHGSLNQNYDNRKAIIYTGTYRVKIIHINNKAKLLFIILSPFLLRPAPWAYETVWLVLQSLPNLHTHLLHAYQAVGCINRNNTASMCTCFMSHMKVEQRIVFEHSLLLSTGKLITTFDHLTSNGHSCIMPNQLRLYDLNHWQFSGGPASVDTLVECFD